MFVPAGDTENGRCGMYNFRGLACRLFGFSGFHDKYDRIRFSTCAKIKSEMPDKPVRIQNMIDNGLFVPILSVYRDKISDLNPLLAQKLYPINTAHYLALIKVGYYLKDSSNYC